MDEVRLPGGWVTGAVRVGDTVRRRAGGDRTYVHAVLTRLAQAGWPGAPRLRGTDADGREVLGWIEGDVPWADPHSPAVLASLDGVGRLVREFHDLTAGTELIPPASASVSIPPASASVSIPPASASVSIPPASASVLAGDGEVVCHHDLSPKNTVYRDGRPVAFLDWDLAAPGRRVEDVAHCCWQFTGIGADADPVEIGRRMRAVCDGYRLDDRTAVIDTVLWWQDRCWRGIAAGTDASTARLRAAGVVDGIRVQHDWVAAHDAELRRRLG